MSIVSGQDKFVLSCIFCKKMLVVCLVNKLIDKNIKYLDNYLLGRSCYSFLIKKHLQREEKT